MCFVRWDGRGAEMSAGLGSVVGAAGQFVGASAGGGRLTNGRWLGGVPVRRGVGWVSLWGRGRRRVVEVRPDAVAVGGVRRALWSACACWGVAELGECVAGCASELVTNAVVHAAWPAGGDRRLCVVISRNARALVVEVCDPDPRWPAPRAAVDWDAVDWGGGGAVGESGLGLRLVRERVAELGGQFGCVSGQWGKVVFFVLPLTRRGRGSVARSEGVAR